MRYLIFSYLLLAAPFCWAQPDVNFSGTLVEEPCTMAPEDSDIVVDFSSVVTRYLYANTRTLPQVFRIHLLDCDISLGNVASVQFTGDEDAEQTGMLAAGQNSTAQGIAIGIETLRGVLIPINKPSPNFSLTQGDNTIYLSAFVQASADAIKNKTITPGTFTSIATFEISYD